MQPTITLAEANSLVESYLQRANAALPPTHELTLQERQQDYPCDDPSDNGPRNRRSANVSYQLKGVPREEIPQYFDALRNWWQANGFAVLKDAPKNEFLWGENKSDGFRMTLQANHLGAVYLLASSPCVWRNGTPEPTK